MIVKIFTDGSCLGNPGPGGWCSVFCFGNKIEVIKGREPCTTNNGMELKAVEKTLEVVAIYAMMGKKYKFEILSDSAYVINSLNQGWVKNWERNGWKTSKGEQVKNKESWINVINTIKRIKAMNTEVKFTKVKGHSGNSFNEMADEVAKEEANKSIEE